MGTLLKVVGAIWALVGLGNLALIQRIKWFHPILICSTIVLLQAQAYAKPGIAIGDEVYTKFEISLFSEPKFQGREIAQIPPYEALNVTGSQGDWFKIITLKGLEGWVSLSWIVTDKQQIESLKNEKRKNEAKMIHELEDRAKSIPSSDIYANIEVYENLIELSPDNEQYKTKLSHYKYEESKLLIFRKTRWGMTADEIIKSEGSNPAKRDQNTLFYKDIIDGRHVTVIYFLVDDKLVRGRYFLDEKHTNDNDYIDDYDNFKQLLIRKYGKPKPDDYLWRNELYQDNQSKWGFAVSVGHLVYFSKWQTPTTDISMMLTGDNYNIYCYIDYTGRKLAHTLRAARENESLNQL